MKHCTIIGISDSRNQWFPPDVMKVIYEGKVFSGGKRHHEIMADYLPKDAIWIDITVPLSEVFERYRDYDDIVIFASGDPLFYGFANTVQREYFDPSTRLRMNAAQHKFDVEMKVYPSFNSLQMLAHRLCLPYQDMKVVSLTGRPWDKLDEALINGEQLIGCLTDRNKTPNAIAERMQEYGYDNYDMFVGENLGNEEKEQITEYLLNKEHYKEFPFGGIGGFSIPNCVILKRIHERKRPFGIPESEFCLLDGREKMITKMPIRLLSLSMLDLHNRRSLWDIGFCTGSVSIEAKMQFPHLSVTAFEIREQGRELMEKNSRKFGTPGIKTVIDDFLTTDLTQYPRPDSVFIGGHGGKLKEMMQKIYPLLNEGGVIVMNSVTDSSHETFTSTASELGMTLVEPMRVALNDFNPITILKALR